MGLLAVSLLSLIWTSPLVNQSKVTRKARKSRKEGEALLAVVGAGSWLEEAGHGLLLMADLFGWNLLSLLGSLAPPLSYNASELCLISLISLHWIWGRHRNIFTPFLWNRPNLEARSVVVIVVLVAVVVVRLSGCVSFSSSVRVP